ncbi:MAG: dethiobiotin synthetase [Solirubrobacteraceae bacterium]|nr:dethiobiotin synthetase [Solirubrobacteraceae bacterium]
MGGIARGGWQLAPLGGEEQTRESKARGIFVTATSTEIGKTVVAAALARTLASDGQRVAVFKPCVTGMDEFPGYDEAAAIEAAAAAQGAAPARPGPGTGGSTPSGEGLPDHALLRLASGSSQTDAEIAPYRYDPPMSPHLAAGLAGEEIDPERVMAAARAAAAGAEAIVCEGVGGLLVPLTPSWTVRSLAVELGYPLVIVAPPGLGTINHTLLTVESARQVGLKVAAIVLNPWPAEPTTIESDNRETIAAMSGAPVLTLPRLDLTDLSTWPALRIP